MSTKTELNITGSNSSLLEKEPSAEDMSSSKTAIRYSNYLARLLRTNNKHIYTLVGSQGSGKSTVIELLKNELIPSEQFSIFEFDVLNHKNDAIKRAFLHNLIMFIMDTSSLKPEAERALKILEKKISGSYNEEDSNMSPRITWYQSMMWVAVLFSPILLWDNAWPFIKKSILPSITHGHESFAISIILLLLFAGLSFLAQKFLPKMVFFKKILTFTKITTVNPDNSTIEFTEYYNSILHHYLESNKDKQLLIIFENIDRLDDNEADEIFGNLQNFLSISPLNKSLSINFILACSITTNEGSNSKWVKKLSDVVLQIPNLDTVDQEAVFYAYTKKAFPKISDYEIRKVYNIYRFYKINSEKVLPHLEFNFREIKLFLNGMVALDQMKDDDSVIEDSWYVYLAIAAKTLANNYEMKDLIQCSNKSPINKYVHRIKELMDNVYYLIYGGKYGTGTTIIFSGILHNIIVDNNIKELLSYIKADNWFIQSCVEFLESAHIETVLKFSKLLKQLPAENSNIQIELSCSIAHAIKKCCEKSYDRMWKRGFKNDEDFIETLHNCFDIVSLNTNFHMKKDFVLTMINLFDHEASQQFDLSLYIRIKCMDILLESFDRNTYHKLNEKLLPTTFGGSAEYASEAHMTDLARGLSESKNVKWQDLPELAADDFIESFLVTLKSPVGNQLSDECLEEIIKSFGEDPKVVHALTTHFKRHPIVPDEIMELDLQILTALHKAKHHLSANMEITYLDRGSIHISSRNYSRDDLHSDTDNKIIAKIVLLYYASAEKEINENARDWNKKFLSWYLLKNKMTGFNKYIEELSLNEYNLVSNKIQLSIIEDVPKLNPTAPHKD